jgi:DHA1 family bicyclomycin/chloramphenicol resistance-like MFS transporter
MLRPGTLGLTALLALLTALGPVATDMYLPSLPDIGRALSATPAEVQLTISSYLIGFAGGQVIYGPLSDRFGRKPVLFASLLLFCVATIACALAPTIGLLIAARVLQALGGAGAIVIARAIVRDLYTGARAGRELSLMGAIMALAPIIAPIVGGILQAAFGWRASFLVAFAFAVAAAAVVWRLLPETRRDQAAEPLSAASILHAYGTIARHPGFLAYLGILTTSFAGLFAWISASPFVLQELHALSPLQFGFAFAAGSVGYLTGTAIASRYVSRLGLNRTIGAGTVALAVGGLAMVVGVAAGWGWIPGLVLPAAVYLAGLGMVIPQTIAGALTPFPDRAGTASSLVGLVQQSFAALTGAVVGHLIGLTAWPLAGAMALMGTLSLLVWTLTRSVRRRNAASRAGPGH